MLDARDPYLLAVDDVFVALAFGGGLDLGGVGAGGRFGHSHGLQAQFAGGDLGQVKLLLFRRAVAQQGVHVVHLAMAGAGIATLAVDFLHHHRRFAQPQAGASEFLGNQRGHPAGLGERLNERFWIGTRVVDLLPIGGVVLGAQGRDGFADFGKFVGCVHFLWALQAEVRLAMEDKSRYWLTGFGTGRNSCWQSGHFPKSSQE